MQRYTIESVPSTADPQVEPARVPYNLDAEQAVLGCLLVWNDAFEDVPFLRADHFYDPLHQAIYSSIYRTVKAGRLANPVTLASEFEHAEKVDRTTTVPQYLGMLGIHAVARKHVTEYAQSVVDLATRRSMVLIGEDMLEDACRASYDISPQVLIEEIEARLSSLAEDGRQELEPTKTFAQAANAFLEDARATADGKRTGLSTGFVDLDAKLGGLQSTDLIVLAGRPSMGKTALATNIAFHVARSQAPVHFFSLEMSDKQIAGRILGEEIEVSAGVFRRSSTGARSHIQKLAEAVKDLADVPLYLDDVGGPTIAQLVARARRVKRRHKIGLIVVDYLQLMQASRRRENRVQDITEITTGLKALAKELHVPVIALSQLSREVEKRDNKRPQLSDLRESGSIEQDADVVLFVYRDEYYLERKEPQIADAGYGDWLRQMEAARGKATVIVGKHRHGELGSIDLSFTGELTRFGNLAREAR